MELYEKVFGKYINEKSVKSGNNIMINCLWHKDDTPSLGISTDPNNLTYHCFGCGKKGSLIGAYMELNGVDYKTALKQLDMFDDNYKPLKPFEHPHPEQVVPKAKKEHIEVDYSEYCYRVWNDTIMSESEFVKYGKKLYELRGITYDTAVACMIGYDSQRGWIFPIIRYGDNKTVGYEVRQKEFKKFSNGSKCFKAENTPSCLSVVWQGWDSKKAVVCEGFCDSYFMYQYLHEKAQMTEKCEWAKVKETILTPSNGVKTIPELIKQNELWNKFDEVLFVIDNDPYKLNEKTGKMESPGNDTIAELKQIADQHGRNFKFYTDLKEGQDWEEKYKEMLKITI